MVEITYKKNGFGPYLIRFEKQDEAMNWIRSNDITILAIDFIGG